MSRCDFTDLDTTMCAHCTTAAAPAAHPRVAGRWFHAIYPGTCANCGTPFTPGTPIRIRIPTGWIAACCATPTW